MAAVHGAYTAANLLAGAFLSIFLWRASHDLTPIAVYSGLSALMIPAAFLANGLLWRGLGGGASIPLGLSCRGPSYLVVLTLGNHEPAWGVVPGVRPGGARGFPVSAV